MSNFSFTPPPGAKVKTGRLPALQPGFMPGAGALQAEPGAAPSVSAGPPHGPGALPGVQTFGAGWLTVAAIPAGQISGAGPGGFVGIPGQAGSGSSQPAGTPAGRVSRPPAFMAGPGGPGQGLGLASVLLKAATPVHGPWGSGRLLRTSLFSVLLTSKGQLLVGAVTPAVLYADAAKVK